jgi:membrane protease YdiL (CAAX protease family)
MLVLWLASGMRAGQPATHLWNTAGIAVLAEETLFRGFAFGLLLLHARWKVWPAALLAGASFGAVHLVTASVRGLDPSGQLFTTGLIAAGGIAYAWLHYRWRFNLWVPLGLHALMNLWWERLRRRRESDRQHRHHRLARCRRGDRDHLDRDRLPAREEGRRVAGVPRADQLPSKPTTSRPGC